MNKFAKGSLAAGAGLVLLLGGAGTLAYWNSEVDLQGGEIAAGELTLAADQAAFTQSDLGTWVPGDTHTYRTTLTLDTAGDNIQGTVELDKTSIKLTGDGADEFTVEFALEDAKASVPEGAEINVKDEVITFDGEGQYTLPVTVTVAFPFDAATNGSQGASVDLSDTKFIATQTAAGGAVGVDSE